MAKRIKPAQKAAVDPTAKPNWGGEGWGAVRPREKVAHYYRDGAALCRCVALYRGPLEADTGHPGPEDCGDCRKKLDPIGTPA